MTTIAVGLARDLPPQRVMRAQIGETDIALWRSRSGALAAWNNRCPHRGMRLSHGFVRGESLACLYHGWHYNSAGRCAYIPAHPDLDPPETIRTTIYSACEQGGVLWVSVEGPAQPMTLPDTLTPVRSVTFAAALDAVAEAFCGSATAPVPLTRSAPTVLSGDGALWILLQDLSAIDVTAHILASAEWDAERLIAVSRWAEAVRREVEQG